jgi:hypothetical protein
MMEIEGMAKAGNGDQSAKPSELRRFKGWSFAELHSSALAWIILALSAVITVAAWHISSDSVEREAASRFAFETNDIRIAIEKRMLEQEVALWGGVGLFNASQEVSRDEWREYVKSLRLEQNLPGLQGYGYAEYVRHADRAAHVENVRKDGFPDFDIQPAGVREAYASIIYLEPFQDRNLRAFGYDMLSEPTRRAGLERARDSGEAAVSGMVTLVQETASDIQRGFLMYLPVYKSGMPDTTVEERRAALQGFVYSPFRINDLMEGILGEGIKYIDFRIYDAGVRSTANLLYDSRGTRASDAQDDVPLFTAATSISTGGRPWLIEFSSGSQFISPSEANEPLLIAAGGILIDILLFVTIASLSSQRKRAIGLATSMTDQLRKAKEKAEAAADAEIALRTAAQEANAKLQVANDGLLKFTSIVAHDLRSPLKRIESFIDILHEDHADTLNEDCRDILARTQRGSSRMRLMLDSLHNYAKYSDVSIAGKTTSIETVVSTAVETLGADIANAKITVDADEQLLVNGDTMLLSHVMQNLVGNSIKFRGDALPTIHIAICRLPDGMVEISVRDDGIGIEAKHAEKIFGMFTRLHNEDEYEGTGIGLAVCRKIVNDHGGDIAVDTSYGGGTRMVFTLRCAEDDWHRMNADAA